MIAEREQVKRKASAGLSFAPPLRASAPAIDVGVDLGAPSLAPRVGHRFEKMAVVPDTTQTASALRSKNDNAPREGGNRTGKQAAPAPSKREIEQVELIYPDWVILNYSDGATDVLRATYNGAPASGEYTASLTDGKFTSNISTGTANTNGNVVEWEMPEYVNLEGLTMFRFVVSEYGMVVRGESPTRDKGNAYPFGVGIGAIEKETKTVEPPSTELDVETLTLPKGKKRKTKKATTRGKGKGKTQKGVKGGKGKEETQKGVGGGKGKGEIQKGVEGGKGDTTTIPPPPAYEEFKKELDALPPEVKAVLGKIDSLKPEDYPTVLKIIDELKTFSPEELELYALIARDTTDDLALLLKSIQTYKQLVSALKTGDVPKQTQEKSKTLNEEIAEILKQVKPEDFETLSPDDKVALARKISAQVRNTQLRHMASHPLETASDMIKGTVDLPGISAAATQDLEQVFAEGKSGTSRLAHFAGFVGKTANLAMAAATVLLIVQFIPGVNLAVDLGALAGLTLGALLAATLSASLEHELHIQAAGDTKTLKDFNDETVKAASAETALYVILALLAAGGLLKEGLPKMKALLNRPDATKLVEAQLATLKKQPPPVDDLTGIPPEINAIYKKLDKATATEKQIVRDWLTEVFYKLPPEEQVHVPEPDFRKLLGFLSLPDPPPPVPPPTYTAKAEVSAAVEKALVDDPKRVKTATLEETMSEKPGKPGVLIKGDEILRALQEHPTNKANQAVLRVIKDIFETQENPKAYGDMLGEIWERAQKIEATQSTRMEATGSSSITLAMVDMLIERGVKIEVVNESLAGKFTQKILEPGATFADKFFEDAPHGISPHMLQFLVLDEMLRNLKPPTTMQAFLQNLSKLEGRAGLAGDIWDLLLDAVGEDSLRRPEYFMPLLRAVVPGLE